MLRHIIVGTRDFWPNYHYIHLLSSPRSHHLLRLSLYESILRWENIFEQQRPPPHLMHKYKPWDALVSLYILNYLINSAPDDVSRVRISAASAKETGAWLKALPFSNLGLRIDDETIRVAAGLCLGTLFRSHSCHHCHTEVYQFATHNLFVVTVKADTPAMLP